VEQTDIILSTFTQSSDGKHKRKKKGTVLISDFSVNLNLLLYSLSKSNFMIQNYY